VDAAVDLWENDNEIVYAFDLPGIAEDELAIEYEDGSLTQGVSEDAIEADYRDGVLEIRVTKPEQPKPRRIQIGSGGKATIEGKSSKSSK
jgi:HSP20 family molecular chaperone IbpA